VSTAEARSEADDKFFIVGVGASAGGVEALEQLFASMPEQLEAAIVVITH
jgi:two-component system CheB/CheR fusion protein